MTKASRLLPRVLTYNCGSASDERLIGDLEWFVHLGAQVIGLQEAGDRRRALRRFRRRNPSWRSYRAALRPGGPSTPILWDAAAVEVSRKRAPLAVSRRWVGPEGAGPTHSKTKRLVEIDARLRAGGPVARILNTHLIPSADRHDLAPKETAARRRHYGEHVGVIRHEVAWAHVAGLPSLLTADLNATPHSDLVAPLRGATGWHTIGTHGPRPIDQALGFGAVEPVGGPLILRRVSSDHAAVMRSWTSRLPHGAAG